CRRNSLPQQVSHPSRRIRLLPAGRGHIRNIRSSCQGRGNQLIRSTSRFSHRRWKVLSLNNLYTFPCGPRTLSRSRRKRVVAIRFSPRIRSAVIPAKKGEHSLVTLVTHRLLVERHLRQCGENSRQKKFVRALALVAILGVGCGRVDVYYPYAGGYSSDGKSVVPPGGGRAVVLNGTDALGDTVIDVTPNGVRLAAAGGLDNSTSTREGYRTLRYGIGAAAWAAGAVGVANVAANAYGANQAANATSNAAASRAAA